MLRVGVVSLFPAMVEGAARFGVVGRALEAGRWSLACWNPRDYARDSYRTVDDRPYGGGPGMVMLPGPLEAAIDAAAEAQRADGVDRPLVVHLSPQGELLRHERVAALARRDGVVLVAGRYEGIDERVIERRVDLELSIGDYVVSGGELPALVLIDAVVRLLPGVLNDEASAGEDSFVAGLLDCPHYTRPEVYDGVPVPAVLLSGNHEQIRRWRLARALGRTWLRRPELLARRALSAEEQALLEGFRREWEAKGKE